MLKKSEQIRKTKAIERKNRITKAYPQVVLATLSRTRIEMFSKTGIPFIVEPHHVDEEKIKRAKFHLQKEELATTLAEAKARSVENKHSDKIIIGSDQILICDGNLLNKPRNLQNAEQNLYFLAGKKHLLWSSVVAIERGNIQFSIIKKAHIYFRSISKQEIQNYVKQNKRTVLSSVGCYKIEDNKKHGYVKVLSGEEETIKGFPIQELINTLKSK